MRREMIAAAVAVVCAVPAFAADGAVSAKSQGVEEKRAMMLQHIEERITSSQAEITCVKAAGSHDELDACREKYRPRHADARRERLRRPEDAEGGRP